MATIDAITSPLKLAVETVKKLVDLRDAAKLRDATRQLYDQILAAQQGAVAAQQHETTMAEEIRSLKARVDEFEAWDTEKQRYQLTKLPPGVFVYRLKPDMQGSEPMHSICEKCYQTSKKSILHSVGKYNGIEHLKCHSCGADIRVGHFTEPNVVSDYDPLDC
jgi:translation initiation factor 2B subunit (eIF-2B alpha/beta/delta family)